MPTTYAVLLPGGQDQWRNADTQERAETYARHRRFSTARAGRGHQLTAFTPVATDDLDDLAQVSGNLATSLPVEVRPCGPPTTATGDAWAGTEPAQ